MDAPQTAEEIREVNARYHDVAAAEYDRKWGVDFSEVGRRQVLGKVDKALGAARWPFGRSLEVGAGTGYFSLNLLAAGLVHEAVCTDISPGMLATLRDNAARLGVEVETARAEAASLPFAGESFDLVVGHAVLHHLPDLPGAFAELRRVLRPGGTLLFAGEPSRYGDRLAAVPKRGAALLAPLWRRALGAAAAAARNGEAEAAVEHDLERFVDVHAFAPAELDRLACEAGFTGVRVIGEELLANWFGWTNRVLESTAEPAGIPWLWRQYAYRGYLVLQEVDRRLLEGRLPPAVFYNLLVTARRPG